MPRGILATCSAPLADGVTEADLRAAYDKAYADEPFVHLLPEGQWPQTKSVTGSNAVHLQVTVDSDARTGWSPSARSTTSPRAPPAPPSSA